MASRINLRGDESRIRASHIQTEARSLYGQEISEERAFEISIEIERYQAAIVSLQPLLNLNDEPFSFLECLTRLRGNPDL